MHPALAPTTSSARRRSCSKRSRWSRTPPTIWCTSCSPQQFWPGHPLGRPILGTPDTVSALDREALRAYFARTYVAPNFVVVAVGNSTTIACARWSTGLRRRAAGGTPPYRWRRGGARCRHPPEGHRAEPRVPGHGGAPQSHDDRYAELRAEHAAGRVDEFAPVPERAREARAGLRGVLGLAAYRDAGALTVYAGCANEAVSARWWTWWWVEELRRCATTRSAETELRRAKDHLKGSLMLSLENTSSRMSHLARQEIYGIAPSPRRDARGIERVTPEDVLRVAGECSRDGALGATVLGPVNGLPRLTRVATFGAVQRGPGSHPSRDDSAYTHPEMGRIWSESGDTRPGWQVELAAADAMAEAGIVPAPEAARDAAREGRVRHRADRGNRAGHAARRHRLHDRGGREGRPAARWLHFGLTSSDVSTPRRRCRCARPATWCCRRGWRAGGRHPAPGRRAPADADDRPDPRRARRADDVRPEAGAVVRRGQRQIDERVRGRARRSTSARSRARSAPSPTSTPRSRPRSAPGWAWSRRRSRRRSSSATGTPSC
jgi:hypothetical protein